MIGNDVVDLNLAKTQSNWQRPGFLEKQFTQEEQKTILNAAHPFLQVWLFWTMKEAAYKCYVQEHKKRFFAPKKFSCKILSKTFGTVQIENTIYYINSIKSTTYIVSFASKEKNKKMVSNVILIPKKSASTKIINDKILALFSSEISIKKNDLGIPLVYQNKKLLPISLSKSHHGNYGSFAFTLNNEA